MKRWELRPVGVFDRDNQRHVLPTDPAWHEYQRELAAAGGEAPDPEPRVERLVSIEEVRAEKIALVENLAADARKAVVGRAGAAEMSSWGQKLDEARTLRQGALLGAGSLLRIEAEARGVTVEAIAARVLSNASLYSEAEARIAGAAGRHKDSIRALGSVDELSAYDITIGWPGTPVAAVGRN